MLTVIERFWSYVNIVDDIDSCWEWEGYVNPITGYGMMGLGRSSPRFVHRVSYDINYGPFDSFWFVLHTCDNRKCVRPKHLYLGGQLENIRDMMTKGRQNFGVPKKLTDDQVRIIRVSSLSQLQLAKDMNVSPTTIRQVLDNKTYRWVNQTPDRLKITW